MTLDGIAETADPVWKPLILSSEAKERIRLTLAETARDMEKQRRYANAALNEISQYRF